MESKTTPNIYTPETEQVLELIRWETTYQTLWKNQKIITKDKLLIEDLWEHGDNADKKTTLNLYELTKKSQLELNHLLTVSEKDLLAYWKKFELTLWNLNYLETNLLRLLSWRYTYNPSYKHFKSYIWENSHLL